MKLYPVTQIFLSSKDLPSASWQFFQSKTRISDVLSKFSTSKYLHLTKHCPVLGWSPPSKDAKQKGMASSRSFLILCNGTRIFVTENLLHFLRHVHENASEFSNYSWIDALCINQNNIVEKGNEVSKMKRIYQSTARLFVWLGEKDEWSDPTIELIHALALMPEDVLMAINPFDMANPEILMSTFGNSLKGLHWEALGKFLQRAWFTRVWVVQEVLVTYDVYNSLILCGNCKIGWNGLFIASGYIFCSSWKSIFSTFWPGEENSARHLCFDAPSEANAGK
jgi:hypothetical protein